MGNILNKKVIIGIVAVILIVWFFSLGSNDSGTTGSTATTTKSVATGSVAKTTTTVKKAVPVASQPVSMSYTNALALYKDNKRIQLSGDSFCQVTPNNVMYKNGTSIMIDNRSAKTRTVKLLGSHTIAGYGFTILKLSSGTLPATLLMDCDTQQNVAKVLLQK